MSGNYEWVTRAGAKFALFGMKEDTAICPYCGRYFMMIQNPELARIPDHSPPRDKGSCPASGLELYRKQKQL